MVFTAKVEDLEIRGKEIKDGKNGEYAVVRFDNASGDKLEFIDRDKDRFGYYKRGKFRDIWLKITDTAKNTNFTIIAMKYMKDED